MNVTTPVVVFTVYVPSPATVSEVALQFGADWPAEHNFTEVASLVPLPLTSLVSGLINWSVS